MTVTSIVGISAKLDRSVLENITGKTNYLIKKSTNVKSLF